MDEESKIANMLLETLASCNTKLLELYWKLGKSKGVKKQLQQLEIRQNGNRPIIDGYVEAYLENEKVVCWLFEVNWDSSSWEIDASVRINDDQGENIVKRLAHRSATQFVDFIREFEATIVELVRTASEVDLITGRVARHYLENEPQ